MEFVSKLRSIVSVWLSHRFLLFRYEKDYTYETFAAALVRDLDLPDHFYIEIAKAIKKQVIEAKKYFPWHQVVQEESLHPIVVRLRWNDMIFTDRFEVFRTFFVLCTNKVL